MFCLCLVSSYQTSWHKKAPAFLEEAQGCHACDISDWKRCRMKHNESPTLFVRGHYRFCFCVILVFQFYVTRSEMNLVLLFVSYFLLPCPFLLFWQTPKVRLVCFQLMTTNKKRGCLHLPVWQSGLPQPKQKTNRETPTLRYIDTRKVCVEATRTSQHTTESIYYTPWSYPSIVLVCFSIVVVRLSKNKASVTPSNM
jgi:hypothetical protein